MERKIFKEQLKEAIGEHQVKAALFYTFNFDPSFFENYIMPLLVPDKNFQNEVIYNNILWRRCAKEGIIPPVTVYCDHYAKDNSMAPTLGYEIRCIRLGGKRNAIVNFHPKECWLLLDNEQILQVNASANLTPSGWCENLECFAILPLYRNSYPKTVTRNRRQRMLETVAAISNEKHFTLAEQRLYEALRYTDESTQYFSNFHGSFANLVDQIVEMIAPHRLEIIAPYMYGEADLLEIIAAKNIPEVHCLIPSLKTNEVLLAKDIFVGMLKKGVQWCNWIEKNIGNETRNLHAKVYRFYGEQKTITITGSVNFTGPAWRHCTADQENEANVESAVLHIEERNSYWLTPLANINVDAMKFLSRDDVNVTEMTCLAGREAPYLNFTLNWKNKTLSYSGKLNKQRVRFKTLLLNHELNQNKGTFDICPQDIKQLSKNALIELVNITDEHLVYTYYPQQIEIESRPLNFRLDPNTILNFWLSGSDSYTENELISKIAEQVTADSGEIVPENFSSPSLLNDMARHFSALISLEKKLFDQRETTNRNEQFRSLRYYLLSENLDTLPFYVKGLRDLLAKQKISNSFFWMVLQILRTRFYELAQRWPHKHIAGKEWTSFKSGIIQTLQTLTTESGSLALTVEGLKEKAEWFITQIRENHD